MGTIRKYLIFAVVASLVFMAFGVIASMIASPTIDQEMAASLRRAILAVALLLGAFGMKFVLAK